MLGWFPRCGCWLHGNQSSGWAPSPLLAPAMTKLCAPARLLQVLVPAANEGRLPLRVYAFVALPTWCVAAHLPGGSCCFTTVHCRPGRPQQLDWIALQARAQA